MKRRIIDALRGEKPRFALVGVVNTSLDLGIYVALQLAGVPVVLANLVSTSAGLGFSYGANRMFTFSSRSRGSEGRRLVLFVGCTCAGLWVLQPLVILAVGSVLGPFGQLGDLRVLVAKLGAIGVGMVWNWTAYSRIVFRADRLVPPIASAADPAAAIH